MIHGDAWWGNLLRDGDRVVLADWDNVSTGPREIDLIPTLQAPRFGLPEARTRRVHRRLRPRHPGLGRLPGAAPHPRPVHHSARCCATPTSTRPPATSSRSG